MFFKHINSQRKSFEICNFFLLSFADLIFHIATNDFYFIIYLSLALHGLIVTLVEKVDFQRNCNFNNYMEFVEKYC